MQLGHTKPTCTEAVAPGNAVVQTEEERLTTEEEELIAEVELELQLENDIERQQLQASYPGHASPKDSYVT